MCRLQEDADAGRIVGVIKNMMGSSPSFTMESIRDGDQVITEVKTIATLVTSFFAKWFARLPEEKDRDKGLADCVMSRDRSGWDLLTSECGIPTEVSSNLWDAFSPKPLSAEGMKEAEQLSQYVPSIDEFRSYIKNLNPRSAPGFSGLS
jgi:hypothetical protein